MALEARWRGHVRGALSARLDWEISKAIREHGPDSFQKKILHECESKEELNQAERACIAEQGTVWPGGYNMTNGGEGPCELTRQKISSALRGRPRSAEHCAAISRGHTGLKRTEKARQAMSEAQKLRAAQGGFGPITKEHVEALRRANVGRKHTEESRRKMRENRKPRVIPDEERQRRSDSLSRAMVGRKMSCESRAKSRASNLKISEDQRTEIRTALAAGATLKSQAVKYDIGVTTVCRIRDEVLSG